MEQNEPCIRGDRLGMTTFPRWGCLQWVFGGAVRSYGARWWRGLE